MNFSTVECPVEIPSRLVPIFEGAARYRCAYGGRGSGKTRTFATMFILRVLHYRQSGVSGTFLCAREHMSSIRNSSKRELESAIERLGCTSLFKVGVGSIRTIPNFDGSGDIEIVFAGLRHNISNIKSMSNILCCWVDEAEDISESSWRFLLPTVRGEGSEIWATWNPMHKGSATDVLFRQRLSLMREELKGLPNDSVEYVNISKMLSNYKVTEINYKDNPWFPSVLEEERKRDEATLDVSQYKHTWEGHYVSHYKGSYYSKYIDRARSDNRVCDLCIEPTLPVYSFWDLGGTGRYSDATSIWLVQFVGERINLLEYIEGQGQEAAYYINELRSRDLGVVKVVLPHDGRAMDRVTSVSYEGILTKAGYYVDVVGNQGSGAAMLRINAARHIFHRCYFDQDKTKGGLIALESYHAKWNEHQQIYVGVNHDWASHAADAFGLMAVWYGESNVTNRNLNELSRLVNRFN